MQHKQHHQEAGPTFGALDKALDSINTGQTCSEASVEALQGTLGLRLWRCCDRDYCSSWRDLTSDVPSHDPPRRKGLEPPERGLRAAVPPGYTPKGALALVPKLLSVLNWLLKGSSTAQHACRASGLLYGLQQALHGVVTASLDAAMAPRSGQHAFVNMLQRKEYLATTARCLAAMAAPSRATPSTQLNLQAQTALATMEALHMLMDALRWTKDPELLAMAPSDEACEAVYTAVSAPGLLPRLSVLEMAVAEVAEARGAKPGSDPALTAAVMAGSRFAAVLVLFGDRLSRMRNLDAFDMGPLAAAMAHLVASTGFMTLAARTLATALHWLCDVAEFRDGAQLLVPHWHEGAPWLDPRPINCSWTTVTNQLHGLALILEAAAREGGCADLDIVDADASFMKLLLEACELCRVWDGQRSQGGYQESDVYVWQALKFAFFVAAREELTAFVGEAGGCLVNILCAVVEEMWGPDAAAEHHYFIQILSGCMISLTHPDQARMVVGIARGLYRRAAALATPGDGRLMMAFEAIVRCKTALGTNHVPLFLNIVLPNAMPKMLRIYTDRRLADRTYCVVTSAAKWLRAVLSMLRAAAAPSAAAARSVAVQKRNPKVDVCTLEDLVAWDWRMALYGALAVADSLSELAKVSFSWALYWLDERLVPISPSTPEHLLASLQQQRAVTIELLIHGAEGLHQRSPHDIRGVRLMPDGSMYFAVSTLGVPAEPEADMGLGTEQLGQAFRAHLEQEERKRQQRRERKRRGVEAARSGSGDVSSRDHDRPVGRGGRATGSGGEQVFVLPGGGVASDQAGAAAGATVARSFAALGAEETPDGTEHAPLKPRPSGSVHSPHTGASSATGGNTSTSSTAARGAPDLSAMALLVGCRAGGAAAAALPGLAALEAVMAWQPRPRLEDGRVQDAVTGTGMTAILERQEAQRMVLKISGQLREAADLALKLSNLLCPHLPLSQAAILRSAMASSGGSSSREGCGAGGDEWLRVVTVLQHVMPPKPPGCWNPACVNLEGKREADLTTFKCARCRARYCSRACQKAHWKLHKETCGSSQAAGAQ